MKPTYMQCHAERQPAYLVVINLRVLYVQVTFTETYLIASQQRGYRIFGQ